MKFHKVFLIFLITCNISAKTINTVFGNVEENNPLILQLIDSSALQRLKHIDQSGPQTYFHNGIPTFSRYDHSIGVYALLKRYNVSEQEQIAGLMHDVSHTVFSHVADILFQKGLQRKESYQDYIHNWFLQQMQVDKLLADYNLNIDDISPKNPKYLALEQPYPDMNADRIEYNLHTALVYNDLTEREISDILAALHYANNHWYFDSVGQAKKFAKLSMYYTRYFWGSPNNVAMYMVCTAVIAYAMDIQLISKDDFQFGIDKNIVTTLTCAKDPYIQKLLNIMRNIEKHYVAANKDNFDVHMPIKMRGIDPLVMHNNKLQRLSELDADFNKLLTETTEYTRQGVYINFINMQKETLNAILMAII